LNAVATAGALTAADDVAPTGMPGDPAALAAVAFHLLPSVSFSTAPGGPSALRRSAMLNFGWREARCPGVERPLAEATL